jgi:nucleoside-diphosphate-sugar epimerase
MATRALITGATGYVGHRLAARLGILGHEVHVLSRSGGSERLSGLPTPPNLHIMPEGDALAELVQGIAPDLVFHLAAPPGRAGPVEVDAYWRTSLYLMAGAAAVPGLRFVNMGTWWQLGEGGGYRPANLYAAAKQAVHDLLVHFALKGLSACTCAPFDIYGPGDWRGRFMTALCKAFESPLPATEGAQQVNLIHVDDVVAGLLAAANLHENGCPIYTLGTAGPTPTLRQVAERVAAIRGHAPLVDWGRIPYGADQIFQPCPADRPPTGWAPVISLDDGLRDVLSHD